MYSFKNERARNPKVLSVENRGNILKIWWWVLSNCLIFCLPFFGRWIVFNCSYSTIYPIPPPPPTVLNIILVYGHAIQHTKSSYRYATKWLTFASYSSRLKYSCIIYRQTKKRTDRQTDRQTESANQDSWLWPGKCIIGRRIFFP